MELIALVERTEDCTPTVEADVATVYDRHAPGLLRYASKLTRNPDEARDALQEVFLRYFLERSYGRRIDHPAAWLSRVLKNYLTDRFRAAASEQELSPEGMESLPDRQSNPETILRRTELAREMAASLSDRERDCLRLRSEGLCYADIAVAMGVRSGTVGAMLSRAQKKLRPSADYYTDAGTFEAARLVFAEVQEKAS